MVETRQVPLSNELIGVVNKRLNQLGINFPEYIRMLIMIESGSVKMPVRTITKSEEDEYVKAIAEVEGNTDNILKSPEDIDNFLDQLTEEALNE